MTQDKKSYRKLPGKSRKYFGLFQRGGDRLWLAPDHLLYVRNAYYSESSRRFFLKDIQAIVLNRTNSGRTMTMALGAVVAVFLTMTFVSIASNGWPSVGAVILFIFTIMFVIPLVINVIMGPTCICKLHTEVQVEDIVPLRRMRSARKTIEIIKPVIEAAQGRLDSKDLEVESMVREEVRASSHARETGYVPASFGHQAPTMKILKHEEGKMHMVIYYMLLIFAVSSFIEIFFMHKVKSLLGFTIFFLFAIIMILALLRQYDSDMPTGIKVHTWIVMGFTLVFYFIGSTPIIIMQTMVYAALGIYGMIKLQAFRNDYAHVQGHVADINRGRGGPG